MGRKIDDLPSRGRSWVFKKFVNMRGQGKFKARSKTGGFPTVLNEPWGFEHCHWSHLSTIRSPFGRRLPKVQVLAGGQLPFPPLGYGPGFSAPGQICLEPGARGNTTGASSAHVTPPRHPLQNASPRYGIITLATRPAGGTRRLPGKPSRLVTLPPSGPRPASK